MKVTTYKQFQSLISKYKTELIAKAKKTGIVENFGDQEGRLLEDALVDMKIVDSWNWDDVRSGREAVRQFREWAMNFSLEDL